MGKDVAQWGEGGGGGDSDSVNNLDDGDDTERLFLD